MPAENDGGSGMGRWWQGTLRAATREVAETRPAVLLLLRPLRDRRGDAVLPLGRAVGAPAPAVPGVRRRLRGEGAAVLARHAGRERRGVRDGPELAEHATGGDARGGRNPAAGTRVFVGVAERWRAASDDAGAAGGPRPRRRPEVVLQPTDRRVAGVEGRP